MASRARSEGVFPTFTAKAFRRFISVEEMAMVSGCCFVGMRTSMPQSNGGDEFPCRSALDVVENL